jgi:membrane protein YdbS with pleckstrin-like domain
VPVAEPSPPGEPGPVAEPSPPAEPELAAEPSPPGEPGPPADADLHWQRPSSRLLRARRIEVALVTVPLALIGGLFGAAASAAVGFGVAAGVVLAGLAMERFLARRVAAWGFAERNEDLMVRRGVLVRRQSVIPYGRMQFIDITAGPLERSLGLATLRMHTAAAASDARIPGLDQEVAAKLRDQLASLGEAQAAGL